MTADRLPTLEEHRARYVLLDASLAPVPKTHAAALAAVQWPDIDTLAATA